ncbi:MAG: hypothetical protein ACPL1K_07920 [Candidatus Kryptoniota bacterium]
MEEEPLNKNFDYNFSDLIGKRTLIKGDVGTGKTRLTESLLRKAAEGFPTGHITVIDLAPERISTGMYLVGGTMSVPNEIKYLRPSKIWAPRLEGRTKEEVILLAKANAEAIEAVFDIFKKTPTPILFINDLTIYLHAGPLERLIEVIKMADTFVGNAYEGLGLKDDKGSGISERERSLLKKLEGSMNIVIDLNR